MPGNSLNITLPTVGTTVGPTYATQINAAIQALIDDVEANIVTGEITINADLSFASAGTSYGATDLDRAAFTEQGGTLASGNTLSVYAYADELYFQDGAGNNVALTSGGAVAAAAGNITTSGSPTYGASSVELLWVGGDLEYQFKAGASAYADLVFHEADFRNGVNTMVMGSLVTSDYAIHWPAAGPSAAGSVLQSDASGNISFDDSPTFTGLATGNAGFTAAANQDFTVSGTGEYKHGDKTILLSTLDSKQAGVPGDYTFEAATGSVVTSSGGATTYLAIPVEAGWRIKSVTARVLIAGGSGNATFTLYRSGTNPVGGPTSVGTTSDAPTGSGQDMLIDLTGSPHSVVADNAYYVRFVASATISAARWKSVKVVYDRI